MNSPHLNEHDANQGAQSSGEFLGMTGNSGWYLLGSAGVSVMMVIVLWGVMGVSLLLCLFVGLILCLGAVAYVFTLKNGKPAHYDTDFFESALVEAGVVQFRFGPRAVRPVNPFADGAQSDAPAPLKAKFAGGGTGAGRRNHGEPAELNPAAQEPSDKGAKAKPEPTKPDAVVTRNDFDRLQEKLATTEELLEEALADEEN